MMCMMKLNTLKRSSTSSPPNHVSVLTHLLDPEQTFLFGGQTIPLSLAAVITNERRCNRLLRKCFYIPHKGLSAGLVLSCMFSVEQ